MKHWILLLACFWASVLLAETEKEFLERVDRALNKETQECQEKRKYRFCGENTLKVLSRVIKSSPTNDSALNSAAPKLLLTLRYLLHLT